jgi:hypothetical protein
MLVLLTIQHLKITKAKRPHTHEARTMFNENPSNISKFVEQNTQKQNSPRVHQNDALSP